MLAGGLINFFGHAGPDRVGQLWGAADRTRLPAIRERVDPAVLFTPNLVIG